MKLIATPASLSSSHSEKKRKVFIYVLRPALFNASLDKKDSGVGINIHEMFSRESLARRCRKGSKIVIKIKLLFSSSDSLFLSCSMKKESWSVCRNEKRNDVRDFASPHNNNKKKARADLFFSHYTQSTGALLRTDGRVFFVLLCAVFFLHLFVCTIPESELVLCPIKGFSCSSPSSLTPAVSSFH